MSWFGIHDFWTFVGAVLVFLALPGPGTFCLLASTARGGLRGGYLSLAGLLLGDQILMWLAVAGVAAVLQAHPDSFRFIQFGGALYLAWLGAVLIFSRGGGAGKAVPFEGTRDFVRGLLVTLINPKAIVFYMAFFPLFIDPATHRGLPTFVAMAVTIAACTVAYATLLIVAGHALAARLAQQPAVAALAGKLAGLCLVGFGVKLAVG